MKYLKILGLAALAMTALMAFAAAASATTLTSPAGTTLGVGTKLKASSEGTIQTEWGKLGRKAACETSFEGTIENAGGAADTVRVPISFTWLQCGVSTVWISKPGSLEIHTDTDSADSNGTVTWSGAEITVLTHSIIGTVHCLYYTESTPFGTLTGSSNREGKPATLDLQSAELPPKETDLLCSEEAEEGGEGNPRSLVWTGSFTFGTPGSLDVD